MSQFGARLGHRKRQGFGDNYQLQEWDPYLPVRLCAILQEGLWLKHSANVTQPVSLWDILYAKMSQLDHSRNIMGPRCTVVIDEDVRNSKSNALSPYRDCDMF